ncbi:hypothetical protein [Schlesneria sp. DSM 10557]|uniref:hypothetical protein n=1 Tax=Schlesneria sp. DSM 10557 TaxID=3044399 RepID=UPI0035A0F21C
MDFSRRSLIKSGLGLALGSALPKLLPVPGLASDNTRDPLPVAGVTTVYRKNSHADVILGKILEGYQQYGGPGPRLRLVSLFTDQVAANDLSRDLARKHGFRLSRTIDDALTLGTDRIQVAGVLSIAEHGEYPLTDVTRQRMYPRRRFFDDIVATFKRCGQVVPVFNDKHLGYRWEDALAMVETSRAMKFPLLAGSSLPVAWRQPANELPDQCEIEEVLTIGYGGFEDYGFHALEAQQCQIERRRGGETGVAAVRTITGDAILKAEAAGTFSRELFEAAQRAKPQSLDGKAAWQPQTDSAAYLIEYRDGLKSTVVMANGLSNYFATAIKLKGQQEPVVTWFKLQEGPPFGHFAHLVNAIDDMVHQQKTPYPVERTLLTTGILDRVMQSLAGEGKRIETPELAIAYSPTAWPFANHPDSKLDLPND